MLTGHEPYPALAIDRHWTIVAANKAVAPLLSGIEPSLLQPPVNALRLGLHPLGLAPRIANFRYSLANGTTTAFSAARRHPTICMWMADPHIISALREKRAELTGELIAAEKRILQLRDDISSLDRTIRVFDPTAEPHTIRPVLRRKKSTPIPRGQCSRAVLDMLRHANNPMTAREIAAQLAARYQMDASNMDAMNALVAKVRNALARQKGLASEFRGDTKAWMVADGA